MSSEIEDAFERGLARWQAAYPDHEFGDFDAWLRMWCGFSLEDWYADSYGCTLEELRDLAASEGWVDGHPRPIILVDREPERKAFERYLQKLRAAVWDVARREIADTTSEAFRARCDELHAELDHLYSLGLVHEAYAESADPDS